VSGITYQWYASDTSLADIGDYSNSNTVISFSDVTSEDTVIIKVEATTGPQLGSCPDSALQMVIISPDSNSIVGREIFMKQPGNLLVYPDNTMTPGIGYQWGFDSVFVRNGDTITLGPPHNIFNQVYQVFVPDTKFLNAAKELDTLNYCFWVLLRRGDCRSK